MSDQVTPTPTPAPTSTGTPTPEPSTPTPEPSTPTPEPSTPTPEPIPTSPPPRVYFEKTSVVLEPVISSIILSSRVGTINMNSDERIGIPHPKYITVNYYSDYFIEQTISANYENISNIHISVTGSNTQGVTAFVDSNSTFKLTVWEPGIYTIKVSDGSISICEQQIVAGSTSTEDKKITNYNQWNYVLYGNTNYFTITDKDASNVYVKSTNNSVWKSVSLCINYESASVEYGKISVEPEATPTPAPTSTSTPTPDPIEPDPSTSTIFPSTTTPPSISVSRPVKTDMGWKVVFDVPGNITPNNQSIKLVGKLGNNKNTSPLNLQIAYVQRGLAGQAAVAGALTYPAGNWMPTTTYESSTYSVPYVLHNDKYYKLISDKSTGIEPGVHSEWTQHWQNIEQHDTLFTNFVMSNNAHLGSKYGAVFYDNFLYSQYGTDDKNNEIHFATASINTDIFNKTNITNGDREFNISSLNGNFNPHTYIDYFNGEISCNKLSEQYDKFELVDISGSEPMYVYNYRVDLNKSHNISVQPRLHGTSGDYGYCIPGVIILPDYSEVTSNEDGINVCINYATAGSRLTIREPLGRAVRSDATDTGGPILIYNGSKAAIGTSTEGFILVCSDKGVFDKNNYDSDGNYTRSKFENCFLWNGWISKFIMLPVGCCLKLKSIANKLIYLSATPDIDSNTKIVKTLSTSPCNIDWEYKTYYKDAFREHFIATAKLKSNNLCYVKETSGNNIVWVIENSSEFSPIPLHIDVVGDDGSVGTFMCSMPSAEMTETIGLGGGMVNYTVDATPDPGGYYGPKFNRSIFLSNSYSTGTRVYEDGTYSKPLKLQLDIDHPDKESVLTRDNMTADNLNYFLSNSLQSSVKMTSWGAANL